MIKSYVLLIILSTFYLITCSEKEVYYDNNRDIIYHEGKLYFPSLDNVNPTNTDSNSNVNPIDTTKSHETTGEDHELASGAKFWFYILIIFSKNNY